MMSGKTYEEVLEENGTLYWKVKGVSMLPMIREGRDIIIVTKRTKERLKKYDVVLFRRKEATMHISYVLHRILKINADGTYWIVGDNCCSGDVVKEEDILGVLSALVHNGKTIHMDSFLYRVYVHLWCDLYPVRFFILRYKGYPRKIIKRVIKAMRQFGCT